MQYLTVTFKLTRVYHVNPVYMLQLLAAWLKGAIHSQLNRAIFLCEVIPDGKNWVNCAVLTGNNAGLRTVLSSHLSHRELRSSLRESHIFLSLPAVTTMGSSQSTQQNWQKKYVEIKCQLDATEVFIVYLIACSTCFGAPLCPSSGAKEYYTVVAACGIWCCKDVKSTSNL